MKFFDRIVTVANMGVVTAADFQPFIGRENWLTMDLEDMPNAYRERLAIECPNFTPSGVVCPFRVVGISSRQNIVRIAVHIDELVKGGTYMDLDADELAIRMEDS